MEEKHIYTRNYFCLFLVSFLLIGPALQGIEYGSASEPGSSVYATIMRDSEEPSSTVEAQALEDGMDLDINTEEVFGDTGKPGLGGASSTHPLILPVEDEGAAASTREAQALMDGYQAAPRVDEAMDNTQRPGLGGYSSTEPWGTPMEDKETVSTTNQWK